MTELDDEQSLGGDEKIIAEAKRRFRACEEWESQSRKLYIDDLKFANGDSDNGYQWPGDIRNGRDLDNRPCLTVNKTRQHNLQIINDERQNKSSVKVRPVGDEASYEAAEVFEGVIRHIEYRSNAQVAYDTATKFQVEAGMGYFRLSTEYADEDSFDQEIKIDRVSDPLKIYLDPDIQEKDGSDALFGFAFDDMPREVFEQDYPKNKDDAGSSVLGKDDWIGEDHVRRVEYFRKVKGKKDKLLAFVDPSTGLQTAMRASTMPKEIVKLLLADPDTKSRVIHDEKVERYLIVGDTIVERDIWAGKYIPIIRVPGEETVIEGKLDRKGHTRNLKDSQRNYNYWVSAAVEFVALQGKTPYMAPVAAIEQHEEYWETANTVNYSVLPYNHLDDNGEPIPAPVRQQPPMMAPAYIEGLKMAEAGMMMASGQYESSFGEKSNETSGKAINERQRQGDNATFHFSDNLAVAIRFLGVQLIDLIPKVYDTPRTIRIMAEDGEESHVLIDPNAKAAYAQHQQQVEGKVRAIFNPNVGKYSVESDIGPAYATRRQEAFNALTQILSQAPQLVSLVGDLMFKAADFPLADEVAERLERMVPPQAKGEGPSPEVQQAHQAAMSMQGKMQQMQQVIETMTQQLAEEKLKVKGKDSDRDVQVYKAITDRMETLLRNVIVTPKDSAAMLHDLMVAEHGAVIDQQMQEPEQPEAATPNPGDDQ